MDIQNVLMECGDACASLALKRASKNHWRFLYLRPSAQIVGADLVERDLIASGFQSSSSLVPCDLVVVWESDLDDLLGQPNRPDIFVLSDQAGAENRVGLKMQNSQCRWRTFDQIDVWSGVMDTVGAASAVSDFALYLTDQD